MLLALCLLACTSNDPMNAWHLAAPSDQQPVAPGSVTNLPGCATVTVEVSGSNKVAAHFTADSACKTGLVLIPGGAPTYDRPNTGRVTLPVRVLNRSGAGILSPSRLLLGSDSAVVLFGPGLALNGKKPVLPVAPDSTTSGGALWLVGGPGTVAASDSTSPRAIAFAWPDGVQQVRLSFVLLATPSLVGLPIEAIPPDSVMASFRAMLYDSSNLSHGDTIIEGSFPRNVVVVHFKASASVELRRAAIQSVGGILFGGLRIGDNGDGPYLIQVPADGSNRALLDIINRLNAMPQVDVAWVDVQNFGPISTYPNDGSGWDRSSWTPISRLATGDRWGLEAVSAPLAWGCTTGDSTLQIGIVDNGFSTAPDLAANIDPSSQGSLVPPSADSHGSEVMSILGAVGNNGIGMTGMMWRNHMKLYRLSTEATSAVPSLTDLIARGILSAARDHVPVINISEGINWLTTAGLGRRPGESGSSPAKDSSFAELEFRALKNDLSLTAAPLPLMVVGAGNDSVDAWWAVVPRIKELYPDRTIVVAASDSVGRLWNEDLPYRSTGHRQGSNFGPLVDVVAPGAGLGVLAFDSRTGAIGLFGGGTGTSLAAPFVTGIAGLLYSQVRGLSPGEVRQLIIDGAIAAGPPVQSYHLVNAYASLVKLARRPGTPLCGNRVWIAGGKVLAERDGGDEVLHDFGQQMDVVFAHHGGRRISLEYYTPYLQETAMAQDASGHWAEVPFAEDSTIPSFSGAALSMFGFSHDHDSTATFRNGAVTYGAGMWAPGAPAVQVPLPELQLAPGTQGECVQDTATTSNGQFTGYNCSAYGEVDREGILGGGVAWNPIGGLFAYRAIGHYSIVPTGPMQPCGVDSVQGHPRQLCAPLAQPITSERTEVSTIDIAKEAVVSVATIPGVSVRSFGVSEDGTSIVTAALTYTGALDNVPTSCAYEYRAVADIGAAQPSRRINVPELCDVFFDDVGSGFSAVRGYAARSQPSMPLAHATGATAYTSLIDRLIPPPARPAWPSFPHR
ncbi:MAG TPA: S8 family serine peptidase [Gemmatimonadales bacterium]|nr:S8 family serine peptidase [Gemmatimonadales bacterium]